MRQVSGKSQRKKRKYNGLYQNNISLDQINNMILDDHSWSREYFAWNLNLKKKLCNNQHKNVLQKEITIRLKTPTFELFLCKNVKIDIFDQMYANLILNFGTNHKCLTHWYKDTKVIKWWLNQSINLNHFFFVSTYKLQSMLTHFNVR